MVSFIFLQLLLYNLRTNLFFTSLTIFMEKYLETKSMKIHSLHLLFISRFICQHDVTVKENSIFIWQKHILIKNTSVGEQIKENFHLSYK